MGKRTNSGTAIIIAIKTLKIMKSISVNTENKKYFWNFCSHSQTSSHAQEVAPEDRENRFFVEI